MGWVHKETGYRRFVFAYIETAKASGKSPWAAGMATYFLTSDNEERPQIFMMARTADQSRICFDTAVAFVEQDDLLAARCKVFGGHLQNNIVNSSNNGYIRRLATADQGKGISGFIPSMVIADEIHELDQSEQLEKLRKGAKNRTQPLTICITNSGEAHVSVAWDYNKASRAIASGKEVNDAWFSFVCDQDEGDDPVNDESCWQKSNPGLPVYTPHVLLAPRGC